MEETKEVKTGNTKRVMQEGLKGEMQTTVERKRKNCRKKRRKEERNNMRRRKGNLWIEFCVDE
jgi:hypothetical protein